MNPYWSLHHHGAAFENDMVAYRIYFDHRQTVDIYGKYNKGLELKQTQFYPDENQKKAGFGDDVLWVGSTLGLGTLRGWDGSKPTMLTDVEKEANASFHAAHYVQLLKLRMLHGVRNLVRNQ